MSTRNVRPSATRHELTHRTIDAGAARSATFRRTYDATIEDVWEACTDPVRLRRWYAPVQGDLRVGGEFTQGDFGPGKVLRCEAPTRLLIALGGGDPAPDELELRLIGAGARSVLEHVHTTTFDSHEIGGQMFDAIYCMGGGYGPRLETLDWFLRGDLPDDLDATQLHLRDDLQPAIEHSMAKLAELLEADKIKR
jgi:uncharacterized protein YndB with AHSA1/START domain